MWKYDNDAINENTVLIHLDTEDTKVILKLPMSWMFCFVPAGKNIES